jgi:hypothetical protein
VQFLPAFVISNLLEFLGDPSAPLSTGYKLMLLSALRAICEKTSELSSHLAPNRCESRPFLLTFLIQTIESKHLPRQAQDRHEKD